MRPKRRIIPTLSLGQNFRLVMTQEGLTFEDVAKKAKVSSATAYRLVDRTPFSKKERFYQLIGEVIDLFDSK